MRSPIGPRDCGGRIVPPNGSAPTSRASTAQSDRPNVADAGGGPSIGGSGTIQQIAEKVIDLSECKRYRGSVHVLIEAAPGDPELRSLIDELNERRIGHMRLLVEHLAAGGAAPGDSPR